MSSVLGGQSEKKVADSTTLEGTIEGAGSERVRGAIAYPQRFRAGEKSSICQGRGPQGKEGWLK